MPQIGQQPVQITSGEPAPSSGASTPSTQPAMPGTQPPSPEPEPEPDPLDPGYPGEPVGIEPVADPGGGILNLEPIATDPDPFPFPIDPIPF